jgi:hypothetical protein
MSQLLEIAAAAARLIVDEGMEYDQAKKRAARDFGSRAELPDNATVEAAVREHIAIFCADTQPAELRALRELALVWMLRLSDFRPHLSGAVWRGTATRESSLRIDLYCDDPKSAEILLLDKGVDFDVATLDRPGAEPLDVLTVATQVPALGEWVTVHLLVRDLDELRGALKPDSRGQTWRGDTAALRRLLAGDEVAP